MQFTIAPLLVIVSLMIIAVHSLRLGLFSAIAVLFLCSYPSLQFGLRHYFYLQFVSLFFLGVLCQIIFDKGCVAFSDFRKNKSLTANSLFHGVLVRDYQRGILSISAILLVIIISIFFFQRFQQIHLQYFLPSLLCQVQVQLHG